MGPRSNSGTAEHIIHLYLHSELLYFADTTWLKSRLVHPSRRTYHPEQPGYDWVLERTSFCRHGFAGFCDTVLIWKPQLQKSQFVSLVVESGASTAVFYCVVWMAVSSCGSLCC